MLKYAKLYEEDLNKTLLNLLDDECLKYYQYGSMKSLIVKTEDDTWSKLQYVSVKNEKVIGYYEANFDRNNQSIASIQIVNFDAKNKYFFGKDLITFFERLKGTGLRKVNWSVIIGNPAEKLYDKIIDRYGGRIVGVYLADVQLQDSIFYDRKIYEIFLNKENN
jgi:hypothetical protein